MAERVPVLLLSGSMGAGKTTVMGEIADLLIEANVSHACVDFDGLALIHPHTSDDPLGTRLAFRNLRSIWANHRAVGIERLVIAGVVETREELGDYRDGRTRGRHRSLPPDRAGRDDARPVAPARTRHLPTEVPRPFHGTGTCSERCASRGLRCGQRTRSQHHGRGAGSASAGWLALFPWTVQRFDPSENEYTVALSNAN